MNDIKIHVHAGEGYLDAYNIIINNKSYIKDPSTGKIDISILKPYVGQIVELIKHNNRAMFNKRVRIKSVTGDKNLSKITFDNVEGFLEF